jgi:hypothetical protein
MSLLIAVVIVVLVQLALHAVDVPGGTSYVVSVGLGIAALIVWDKKRTSTNSPDRARADDELGTTENRTIVDGRSDVADSPIECDQDRLMAHRHQR